MKKQYALLGIALLSASCSWSNSQIKPFAPIKKVPSYQNPKGEDGIRNAILEQCPLESTREVALKYIHKNFWTLASGMNPSSDIYFRIHEGGIFPVGSHWTDVGFKFDDTDRLKEVSVKNDQVYL